MTTIPSRNLTIADFDRERPPHSGPADYDRRSVETEFAVGGPIRRGAPKRDAAACRVASERERELLKRYGSPVRLDGGSPPAEPIRLPIDDTPPSEPPRPAAVRPLLIPRAEVAPLESGAQSIYPHLTDDARLLLRLLDSAAGGHSVPPFWSVAFIDLVHAFTAEGDDRWEPEARVWKAIHELKRWDIAEILPGQHRGMAALFLSEHAHREMLAARVLHTPHSIPLCPIPDAVILNAKASLAA